MISYQDYEDGFNELNIEFEEDEAMKILDYFNEIIEIAIETYNERG